MKDFDKINHILDKIEELVENSEFDITDNNCNQLYHSAVKELEKLSELYKPPFYSDPAPGSMEHILMTAEKRFKTLSKQFETPEEFIDGVRSMMFPNEEDYFDNFND